MAEEKAAYKAAFRLSKKSPQGGFFGIMREGEKRCMKEKETDGGKRW